MFGLVEFDRFGTGRAPWKTDQTICILLTDGEMMASDAQPYSDLILPSGKLENGIGDINFDMKNEGNCNRSFCDCCITPPPQQISKYCI